MVLVGKRVWLAWGRTPAYYQSSFHNRGGRFGMEKEEEEEEGEGERSVTMVWSM